MEENTLLNTGIVKTIYTGIASVSLISLSTTFTANDFQAIAGGLMAILVGAATIYKIIHDIRREEEHDKE
jgi:hypothetical protein